MNETTVVIVTIITIMRELPKSKSGWPPPAYYYNIVILCMHAVGATQIATGTYTHYEFLKDPLYRFLCSSSKPYTLVPWQPLPPVSDSITIQNTVTVLS